MPGSVLPNPGRIFYVQNILCVALLQHFPRTPAKENVILCSGESRDILHILGLLVSSISVYFSLSFSISFSISFWNTFAPPILCFQGIFCVIVPGQKKIKSFTLRHLVSCSNTTCVEQAKLQLSCLLAIVGSLPNLNFY
jgi:hypothetical protein